MTEELIKDEEKLIYSIIKKYSNYYDKDDLYQVAIIGLDKAYKSYKREENTKFSTYAYNWIRWEILDYIRKDRSIKISKDVISLNKKIDLVKEKMTQKLQREPTTLELSLMLDIDEEKIIEVKRQVELVKSLDYCLNEEEDMNLYDYIKSEEKSYDADIQDLRISINELDEDEQKLIKSRYYNDMTQQETSEILGMSQVQVYRKEKKILKKLEKRLIA
ncbi:MAG: sigma-70 family RNA polymerase sigma factor [Bacilli bacterium]